MYATECRIGTGEGECASCNSTAGGACGSCNPPDELDPACLCCIPPRYASPVIELIMLGQDTAFVEVADSAGAIESRKIEVGLSDGLNIEVIDGLALGDNVVERPPKEIE